jgi:hypothetical protein
MIDPGRAVEIVSARLPRLRRFPRGEAAQVAILAECGKLLADRCETETQAAQFSREFANRREGWQGTQQFEVWLDSHCADIPAGDLRSYAACAHNSILEPLRCGDKFIGWCGKPFPADLIERAKNAKTLLELAQVGRACVEFHQWAETEAAREIDELPPDQRAALEHYARREFPAFLGSPPSPKWAMCLALDEWRKLCA